MQDVFVTLDEIIQMCLELGPKVKSSQVDVVAAVTRIPIFVTSCQRRAPFYRSRCGSGTRLADPRRYLQDAAGRL